MADSELIVRVQPEEVKKGGYSMIKSMPCKLSEVTQVPKATAKGNNRIKLVGNHVFTGKKYEDTINCTAGFNGIEVPVTTKATFSLLDIDTSTGNLSLLTESGETKEDASLSRIEDGSFDAVGADCVKLFDAGEALKVTVLTIMGKDIVVEVHKDGGD